MRRVGWGASLIALVTPAAAAAACPTRGDLADGVYVAYEDGSLSRFRAGADDLVVEDVFYDDGFRDGYRYVTLRGVFPVESLDIVDGGLDTASTTRTVYPDGAVFPPVVPGTVWRTEVTVRSERDGDHAQAISLRVGSPRVEAYGICPYEVLPLELRFQDEVSDTVESLDYVVALGISIFRGGAGFGEETSLQVPVGISREPPGELPGL